MSEIIQSIDSEFRSETHGRITVIFDRHADDDELKAGLPMWRPKVYEAVTKLKPFALAVDSISSGFNILQIGKMIPVDDLSPFKKGFHVFGADVTSLWPDSDNPLVSQKDWKEIVEATIKYDADFSPKTDWTTSFNDMIRRQFAIEESVVSAGEAVLTARILWRIIKSRQAKNVPPQAAYKPRTLTRRDFLKIAGVTAGAVVAAAVNYGREPVFYAGMREIQVTDGTPTMLQTLVLATRPLLYSDDWGNMRDAKLGLSVMRDLSHPGMSKESAVIIFGNGHAIDEHPGQKMGETMEQAKARLLGVMRRGFMAIVKNNQAGDDVVPPDAMAAALTEIFASTDIYFPITPTGLKRKSEITWVPLYSNLIPEIVEVIDNVVTNK